MFAHSAQWIRRSLAGCALLAAVSLSVPALAQGDLGARVDALEKRAENPLAGWIGGRPTIQSEDGANKIQFGSRLQLRYTYQGREKGEGISASGADRSWAELERARLKFHGNIFNKNLKYKIEADGDSDGNSGGLGLTDAYLSYSKKNADIGHSITYGAGQFKPFSSRQEKTSSGKQLLVDRSLANEFFNADRGVGIWVDGRKQINEDGFFNAIGYHVSIVNGFDSPNRDINDDGTLDQIPAIIAHLDFDLVGNLGKDALSSGDLKRRDTPGLTSGLTFLTDQNNGSADNALLEWKIYQVGVDTVYKFAGINVNVEYFGRFLDVIGDAQSSVYTHGGLVEGGYMLTEKLQLVGRGSVVWDRDGSYGADTTATEVAAGVNYFFYGHKLKVSADVGHYDIPASMTRATEGFPGAGSAATAFSSSSANIDAIQGVMVRVQAQLDF